MKILVIGGAGYIGSHFAKVAKAAGHEPIVFDNLSLGHKKFVKFGPFIKGDLLNTLLLAKTLKKYQIETVVHFAARSIVSESMEQPELYYDNNVGGIISLLNAMSQTGVKKLVFSSSAAVYGEPRSRTIKESSSLAPVNPYGSSKLIGEEMILDFCRTRGLKAAILRYFNVIGADPEHELWEDHRPETHLVPSIFNALKNNQPFYIFGDKYKTPDGTCVRDYVDVSDLVLVHLKAIDYLRTGDLLISNIGAGRGYSVKEVYKTFKKVFGAAPELIIKPPRPGDPPRLVADAKFFRKWCGVKLKSLEESLKTLK